MVYKKVFIKDGQITLGQKKVLAFMDDGEYLMILLKTSERTVREWQQYYFAVLDGYVDTGYTKDEIHQMVKTELFKELWGKKIKSTTQLDCEMWNVLFFNLRNWLALKFENH